MRLGVLKQLKLIKAFFDDMERGVKSRDPARVYPAYIFLTSFAYHVKEGDLSPLAIELKQALLNAEYIEANNKGNNKDNNNDQS